jgi:hypothetical protein
MPDLGRSDRATSEAPKSKKVLTDRGLQALGWAIYDFHTGGRTDIAEELAAIRNRFEKEARDDG